MIFKGQIFRISKTVVMLPSKHNVGAHKSCIMFGQLVKQGQTVPKTAVKSGYRWEDTMVPAMAVPIKGDKPHPKDGMCHSMTNLMYGADGRMYLAYKGKVYTRIWRRKEGSHDKLA